MPASCRQRGPTRPDLIPLTVLVPQAVQLRAISWEAESFLIPAAPDLIPDGPWAKVEGGVCAAKGFKATGESGL